MMTQWETPEERTQRLMKIPLQKKLELLEEMHEMIVKTSSKEMLALRWKLRENPSRDGKF